MLRLLHISDWHATGDSFKSHMAHELVGASVHAEPDVIVMTGDMVANTMNFRDNHALEGEWQRPHFEEMLDYCWQLFPGVDVLGVRGNHDFFNYGIQGDHYSGIDVFTFKGYKFASIRGVPVHVGVWNDEMGENKLAMAASEIPDDTQILITHAPPFGILDDVRDVPSSPLVWGDSDREIPVIEPRNIGSYAFRERILALEHLQLHMFGHVHEQGGMVQTRNNVVFSNASCTSNYIVLPLAS
jgi:Icc-related predicted phosphoesterase